MSGYVRLYRSLIGHPAFRNDAEAMAFAWMIARASWRPCRKRYKGHPISLERGQLCISQRDMAAAMDRDKAWIERLWKRLIREAMVEAQREAAAMLITICNYDKYQQSSDEREAVDEANGYPLFEADVRQGRGTEQGKEEEKKEEEGESEDSLVPKLEPKHVVEAWNEMAERIGLSKVRKLSDARMKMLKVRIRQHPIEDFTEAISAIERSSFLRGEGRDGWRADFDFFIQPKSFIKLIEGSYDRSTH